MHKDIKLIIESLKLPSEPFYQNSLRRRYTGLVKAFKKKGFSTGFVTFDDLMEEIKTGKLATVYNHIPFTNNFSVSSDKGVASTILMPEVYQGEATVTFDEKRDNYSTALHYFSQLQKVGDLQFLVNSAESMKSQDKKWLIDVSENLPGVSVPETFVLNSISDLDDLIQSSDKSYIMKPRLGFGGVGIYKISPNNYSNIDSLKMADYIVQENLLPLLSEIRLLFGPDQTFIASHVYFDRIMPWDDWTNVDIYGEIQTDRANKVYHLEPSVELLDESKKILQYSQVDAGCVDWLVRLPSQIPEKDFSSLEKQTVLDFSQNKNLRFLAEVNGFGTNFAPDETKDYNAVLADLIANKYLK